MYFSNILLTKVIPKDNCGYGQCYYQMRTRGMSMHQCWVRDSQL